MTPRRLIRWKSLWFGILVLGFFAPWGYQKIAEVLCRREGEQVVGWIEAQRSRSGSLPEKLAAKTRYEWDYAVNGQEYFLQAYYSGISRNTLEYSSEDAVWMVNKSH